MRINGVGSVTGALSVRALRRLSKIFTHAREVLLKCRVAFIWPRASYVGEAAQKSKLIAKLQL